MTTNLLIFYFAALSVITFLVWGYDKLQAQAHRRRVSERMLLTLVLIGGAFGALLGMLTFRHKTRKPLFWIVVVIGCVFHAAVIYYLSR